MSHATISPAFRGQVVRILNWAMVLALPVWLDNLLDGDYDLVVAFGALVLTMYLYGRFPRLALHPWFRNLALPLVVLPYLVVALVRNQELGSFWIYPCMVFFFLAQSRRVATLSSALQIVVVVPIAYLQMGWPPTLRLLATSVLVTVMSSTFLSIISKLQNELRDQAYTDPLTGVFNRRYLHDSMAAAVERFARNGAKSSIVSLDLDHFKRVNDDFGHDAGDRVLLSLADLLLGRLRRTDLLFRVGGEEFLLLLGDTELANAATLAEELRAQIFAAPLLAERPISVSMGVAEIRPGEDESRWLTRADNLLYRAKELGRNQVVAA